MNLADLYELSQLNGFPLLDRSAVLAGGGTRAVPSETAKPLITLDPTKLAPLQGQWKDAAGHIKDHTDALNIQISAVLANWSVPDSFQPYMTNMVEVLGKQQKAMNDLDSTIDSLASTMQQFKSDTITVNETHAEWFHNIIVWGILTAAAVALVAMFVPGAQAWYWVALEAVIAGVLGALAGGLGTVDAYNYAQRDRLDHETDGLKSALASFQTEADSQHVAAVTPPAEIAINWQGYKSIHQVGPTR